MNQFNIPIFQIPSIKEITPQEKEVTLLRPVEPDDLQEKTWILFFKEKYKKQGTFS